MDNLMDQNCVGEILEALFHLYLWNFYVDYLIKAF